MKSERRTNLARMLRGNGTKAERMLWHALCDKQLEGMKFRRQQPIGSYIVDFVSFEKKLIIEIDGGQHSLAKIEEQDLERSNWLEKQGFSILRFWNNDVLQNIDGVATKIIESL